MRKIQIAISSDLYQIDMTFDRQLRPATETLWVLSYGGKTIPRWLTAAILKIDFHEILYTAADFELGERHVIKMKKLHWTDSEFDRTYFLLSYILAYKLNFDVGLICGSG